MERRYIFIESVDSTNNRAKSIKDLPNNRLTVIRAKRQTSGRGRGDNTFFSNHNGGLWVSIVTPIDDISTHFKHNRALSLAILNSLKESGTNGDAPVSIKWPNDIYWNGKKIAGILLENTPDNPNLLIVGFGINVNIGADDFPEPLRGIVTSVLIETGREIPIERLLEDIIDRYLQYVSRDQAAIHELYCNNLYKRGYRAAIGGHAGRFVTVDTDGRLRLDTADGPQLCSSGTPHFLEES